MAVEEPYPRGTQVIRFPPHVDKPTGIAEFSYPNGPEPGFITSGPCKSSPDGPVDAYYVRFWHLEDGKPTPELRNKGGSENTPASQLLPVKCVPAEWVEAALKEWC